MYDGEYTMSVPYMTMLVGALECTTHPITVVSTSFRFPVTLVARGEFTVVHKKMENVISTPSSEDSVTPTKNQGSVKEGNCITLEPF